MGDQDNKEIVYYVLEGRMKGAWIIAKLNFELEMVSNPSQRDGINTIADMIGVNNSRDVPFVFHRMVNRPGIWYLVSGMDVVHSEDCYPTKQEAAEGEMKRLMGEK